MQQQIFKVKTKTGEVLDTLTTIQQAIDTIRQLEDHDFMAGQYSPDYYKIETSGPRAMYHAKTPEMARRIKDQFFNHPGFMIVVAKQSTEIGECPAWQVHDKWGNWIATIIIDEFLYTLNA